MSLRVYYVVAAAAALVVVSIGAGMLLSTAIWSKIVYRDVVRYEYEYGTSLAFSLDLLREYDRLTVACENGSLTLYVPYRLPVEFNQTVTIDLRSQLSEIYPQMVNATSKSMSWIRIECRTQTGQTVSALLERDPTKQTAVGLALVALRAATVAAALRLERKALRS